jgi:hypothetical protein
MVQLYPLSMVRFGQNPYGDNLYRIVLGKTRTVLNYNGDGTFSEKPCYAPLDDDTWILERWEMPHETKEQWDRGFLADTLGPYPSRGDYVRCEVPLACSVTEANLDKLIMWIEESRIRAMSPMGNYRNRQALKAQYDAETEANRALQRDIIDNAFSAFLNRPFVSTSPSARAAKRGSKTRPILRTADELGLPTRAGQVINIPNRNRGMNVGT